MKSWYIKDNGMTTLFGDQEDILKNHPSAIKVSDRPAEGFVWGISENNWVVDKNYYLIERKNKYPSREVILDAIIEQFIFMNANDKICAEMSIIIDKFNEINSKYPKQ